MTERPSDTVAPSTLARLQLATVAAWAGFAALNGGYGRWRSVTLDVAVLLATLLAYAALRRRPERWRPLMHATAGLSCGGLVVATWWSGGADAVAYWYLAAAPLFAAYVGGRRSGSIWAALAAACAVLAVSIRIGDVEFIPTAVDHAFAAAALIALTGVFGTLARDVADARQAELEEAVRTRTSLLATIGHEVRTPLHGMMGAARVLIDSGLSAEQRELADTIRVSGRALRTLVDDVLDATRIETGGLQIEPHPMDLFSVAEDVGDLFAAEAAAKGVTVHVVLEGTPDAWALGDENRVRQILANLVSNAVKFTREGQIVVRASARPDDEGHLSATLRVEDTGPGVDPSRAAKMFRPFAQPSLELRRAHEGSGLGLALASQLTQRMGGTLRLDPSVQTGAAFELTLRLPVAPARASAPPTHARVLVCDAGEASAEATLSVIESVGAHAAHARTLSEATAAVGEAEYDLVLVRPSPELDVVEAAEALARARVPTVLVIPRRQVGALGVGAFDGATIAPVRRSRLRGLVEDAKLSRESAPRRGLECLVVDDDATNRLLMRSMLESSRHAVTLFEDPEAAVSELSRRRFDVLLCDLNMPVLSGLDVLARVEALPDRPRFVMVTASAREDDRARCLEAGVDGYLAKPFSVEELDALIAELVPDRAAAGRPASARLDEDARGLVDHARHRRTREAFEEEADEVFAEQWVDLERLIGELEQRSTDPVEARRLSHTIASSALQSGYEGMGQRARALEMAEDVDAPAIRAAAVELARLAERTRAELESARDGHRLRLRLEGTLDVDALQREIARAREAGARYDSILVDCAAMTSYEPEARAAFEDWLRAQDPGVAVAIVTANHLFNVVVRAMGLAADRTLQTFSTRAQAEAWLSRGGEPLALRVASLRAPHGDGSRGRPAARPPVSRSQRSR